ncbi:LysR family transcriptional regulator ArgP [Pseudocolwellia sp. AS88]|uniref:LysR family transcriptional regulator ArgP n=1 Tax=Pseudocolwellia sp. AS88 TaxID=3063958 RepID=UPI0026EA33E5|nr:LysR family transcriptional regulator ArgP [Pseudocolwellia sp. AS88]MDO7083321.1 LysR family transcriptional regulator ArgP [Pseudocolwellia sp. AS88]
MKNIDYKLLHAFNMVIKYESFDKAAEFLYLTQSAVSQRIKQLEQLVSQPVLIRSTPLRATEIGKKLLNHYYQVQQLEADLLPHIYPEDLISPLTISLATNADSLATWLIPALAKLIQTHNIELNLEVTNETNTIYKLKNGEVFGAISTQATALPGCVVDKLGNMNYVLVASPDFRDKHFKKGVNKDALLKAPGLLFDSKDMMHIEFIKKEFGLLQGSYPCHIIHSSEAFVNFAKQGLAYCLIAELQIKDELKEGKLINLLPKKQINQTLYWHRWSLVKGVFKKFSDNIIEQGSNILS